MAAANPTPPFLTPGIEDRLHSVSHRDSVEQRRQIRCVGIVETRCAGLPGGVALEQRERAARIGSALHRIALTQDALPEDQRPVRVRLRRQELEHGQRVDGISLPSPLPEADHPTLSQITKANSQCNGLAVRPNGRSQCAPSCTGIRVKPWSQLVGAESKQINISIRRESDTWPNLSTGRYAI